jgi:multimeric flavodoxin WrbA
MKIISVLGGPRKKGNTATILNWVEEELVLLGHQVERINIASKKISGCIGCHKCKDNLDTPGCVQKDDGTLIIDSIVSGDVVIFASPLYYWGFSAQMKALIDRCHCLYRGVCGSSEHTSFVESQRQALIATAADPFERNAEQMLTGFQRFLVYNKADSAGEFFVCNCTVPEDLDEEIKIQAIEFARQLFEDVKRPYPLLFPGGALNLVPNVTG